MGAQHSTSRLNRLSHGGNIPRAPKCAQGTQLQQGNGDRKAALLFQRQNADALRMGMFHEGTQPIPAPLTPLQRKPSSTRDAVAGAEGELDFDAVALKSIPSADITSTVHEEEEEEEGPVTGLQLDDLPVDVLCRILAHVPRASWPAARAVSTLWRDAVDTPDMLWQRREVGLKDPWAILVEWVFGNSKDKRGILWAFDPSKDHTYRLGWVPEMHGINHTSQMVAFGPYALFLGGTVSVDKEDGTTAILPGTAAWGYHLQTGRLRQMPQMGQGRVTFASVVLNRKLIIAGGTGEGDAKLASVEEFDPKTGVWTQLPDMTVPRGRCYGGVHVGRFYVFSQKALEAPEKYAEFYDPSTRKWSLDRKMSPANFSGKAANRFAVVGNKVVLTSDLGPDQGCGSLEHRRSSLSFGNQISWCTSVI